MIKTHRNGDHPRWRFDRRNQPSPTLRKWRLTTNWLFKYGWKLIYIYICIKGYIDISHSPHKILWRWYLSAAIECLLGCTPRLLCDYFVIYMYIYIHVYVYIYIYVCVSDRVCMCIYIYVHIMCVIICVYIYIYAFTYTYINCNSR